MTEEIMNLNTDLKELFTELKTDEMSTVLDNQTDDIVTEITLYNYEIIKKYYDTQKYAVLLQHIKFVAFSSYLCEYTAKRDLIAPMKYESMLSLFENILLLKENNE